MKNEVREEDEITEKIHEVRRTKPELTQLTPLMTQNVPVGMMMQSQMYPAGYQVDYWLKGFTTDKRWAR